MGGRVKNSLRFASKTLGAHRLAPCWPRQKLRTLPAHRLAGAHKRGALYSSRRAPPWFVASRTSLGLPVERRFSARRDWSGENKGLFEHPGVFR